MKKANFASLVKFTFKTWKENIICNLCNIPPNPILGQLASLLLLLFIGFQLLSKLTYS